tara:strand:+ start:3424 stop:4554 length:1131 start_codon:yes stop_codon:yes gene_type:complete
MVISLSMPAQKNNANYRAIKKIERLKKREKFEDAGIRMRKILNIYPVSKILWDDYIKITLFDYAKKIKNGAPNLIAQNSLFNHYNAVYYANMSVPFNSKASKILRGLYVDKIYFTKKSLDEQSLETFQKAKLEMDAQNYQSAIELYEKSYTLDSNNYSALVGLVRAHSKLEYYGKAIQYCNQANQIQPLMNESNVLLVTALLNKGESAKALEVCKKSLLVYPEEFIFSMMNSILENQNKQLFRNWILRLSSINNVKDYYHREQIFNRHLHFTHYMKALEIGKKYYDINGILKKDVNLPINQYLEVYCWEKMLEATKGENVPALNYARYINDKGLLEPYLLINLFNVDLYAQFRHFVENNKSVAENYINEELISDGL